MGTGLGKTLGDDETGAKVGKHDGTTEGIKEGVTVGSVDVGGVVMIVEFCVG